MSRPPDFFKNARQPVPAAYRKELTLADITTKATYSQPCQVETYVKSLTHS